MTYNFEDFKIINFKELPDSMLINRIDSKYIFNQNQLNEILEELKNDYFVVDYGSGIINKYLTTYFDTNDLLFYNMHHNRRNKRLKVRQRTYINSKINFFEIKHKIRKRTMKERNQIEQSDLNENILNFKESYFTNNEDLLITLINKFNRVTLVDKLKSERITIDFNLEFNDDNSCFKLNNLVVLELKQSRINRNSVAYQVMRRNQIRKTNFSKYFVGMNYLRNDIKRNNFKPIKQKLIKNSIEVVND